MSSKTVYLVEDDEGIRDMLSLVLGGAYRVEAFETLRQFRERMRISLPDIIVMDIMLPDGNGDEAGLALQQEERTKDIPMLFMSANLKFQLMSTAARHDFISKPFDLKALQKKVKGLLE